MSIKEYAVNACLDQFGFKPNYKQMKIVEAYCKENGDPQYVRFQCGRFEYSYDGITMEMISLENDCYINITKAMERR